MATPATVGTGPTSAYGPGPAYRPRAEGREPKAGRGDPLRYAGAFVALVAALCFANSLANDFTYDDRGVILHNALVEHVSGIWRAFAHTYWPEETQAGQYRPLVVASYALDWAVSGGGAWWFHLVNLVWHAVASFLAWRLLARLVAPGAALAGAVLFAVHPVHVEAVANVVGRAELMMTAFALGALLLHRRGSPWALLLFALALLSKENGIVLPGIALAHDLLFGEGGWRRALRERRALYAGYGACAAAYLVLLAVRFSGTRFVVPAPTWNGAGTGERLLTMATVVPEYVRLLAAPFSLSIDYTAGVIDLATRVTPLVLLGVAMLAGAVAATALSWRRAPAVALAFLWFAASVSPVANVLFASGIVLAERTLYLPSAAAALLLAAAVQYLLAHDRRRAAVLLAAGISCAFAVRSWTRTPTWRDNKTLMLTVLTEHPESYRAHSFAASVHASRGDWPAADRELAIARRLFKRDGTVYHNAAEASIYLGDVPRALALLDTALLVMPDLALTHLRRAEVRYKLGDYPGAAAGAMRALELLPDTVRAAHVVAAAARQLGDVELALRGYRMALPHAPRDPDLHRGYAVVLAAAGDTAGARAQADSAARLRGGAPSSASPRAGLGRRD
ncbi:MAG: tetratricopeptide repeat protein [Gemmatimonadaceae bacterium]